MEEQRIEFSTCLDCEEQFTVTRFDLVDAKWAYDFCNGCWDMENEEY